MKNSNKQTLVIIGSLALAMYADAALSSTSYASASINWSSFSITGYGLKSNSAPTYSLNTNVSTSTSELSDWLNWSAVTANSANLFAASASGIGTGNAAASSERSADIHISGNGFLVISADYAIAAAINGNSCGSYYYFCNNPNVASATVNFDLKNNSANAEHSSHAQQMLALGMPKFPWNFPSGPTEAEKQGVLTVGVIVSDGDVLRFSSTVSASAYDNGVNPVPVPGAIWLFGSAIVAGIGLGRRKQISMV